MAIGPLARIVAQLVVPVVAVLARALPAAYAQALQNARKAGMDASTTQAAANMLRKTMSKQEALQVLNFSTDKEATVEAIAKQYEKYMAANDVSKGGSFYLQSKVYRAKELLDQYHKEKRMEEKEGNGQQHQQEQQQHDGSGEQEGADGKKS